MDSFEYMNESKAELWKKKYEECEKTLDRLKVLSKKVVYDFDELQKKYLQNLKHYDILKRKYKEKELFIEKFQSVSEAVVKEYDVLKTKYEVEAEATTEVMERASKWYHENRNLKRKSTMLMQKVMGLGTVDITELIELENEEKEKNEDAEEIECFNETINRLKEEIVTLRTEIRIKQEEQEKFCEEKKHFQKLYETESSAHKITSEKLENHEKTLDQLKRVSVLAVQEFEILQNQCKQETERVKRMSEEIQFVHQENDVLEQKNAILLSDMSYNEKLIKALNEIERLQKELKNNQVKNIAEIDGVKAQIQDEITEELTTPLHKKIDCLTKCLEQADERAYTSERKVEMLLHKIQELECQVQRLEAGLTSTIPPPPPPPPPPPLPTFNPIRSLISLIGGAKKPSPTPIRKEKKENLQQRAMSEMIASIKRGEVKLKPTRQMTYDCDKSSTPSAVNNMVNILNSLKKRKESIDSQELRFSNTNAITDKQQGELFKVFERRKKSGSVERDLSTSSSSHDISSEDGDNENQKTLKETINLSENTVEQNQLENINKEEHENILLQNEKITPIIKDDNLTSEELTNEHLQQDEFIEKEFLTVIKRN